MLGIIHDGLKEHEQAQAQAHYEAVLKLNPRFAPAANNLAWILVEHGGNLDVALSHAQMAREQQPNDSYIADTLGWIYYKKMRIFSPGASSKTQWKNYPTNRTSTFITGWHSIKMVIRREQKSRSKQPWNSAKPSAGLKRPGKCWQDYETGNEPIWTATGTYGRLCGSPHARHHSHRQLWLRLALLRAISYVTTGRTILFQS